MQKTISRTVSDCGIGIHSGENINIKFKPAGSGVGILLIRTDIKEVDNQIPVSYINVHDTVLSTSVNNQSGVKVSTIEHLMAALWGCEIDNIIIEIDGPEVPIMDGSSKSFVSMLESAGIRTLPAPGKYLKLLKEINISDNDCEIHAWPGQNLTVDLTIDFHSPAIGKQNLKFSDLECFKSEIANSRTFGFVEELDYLQSKGFAKGASLENAIGIDKDIILNQDGLRYQNEFVRHKVLDLLGDLFTCGGRFIGNINGYKTSHALNNRFLRTIFSDPYSYQWVI